MGKITILAVIAITILAIVLLWQNTHLEEKYVEITGGKIGEEYYGMHGDNGHKVVVKFDLVDPECAPEELLTKILYGYHLMLDTKNLASEYVGNTITCNNCHFNAGNTLGGKNRGISLVGVTEMYPRFSKRDNKDISLVDRLDNCFKRSLNGKSPPHNSLEMESLIAYLAWISHELSDAPRLPWLGLKPLESKHVGNMSSGEKLYQHHCTLCHGNNGEGTQGVPPLWGDNSFNDGAGMNNPTMLSSFIWYNMPYGQANLTPEEAIDIAAYVSTRPRPHFNQEVKETKGPAKKSKMN